MCGRKNFFWGCTKYSKNSSLKNKPVSYDTGLSTDKLMCKPHDINHTLYPEKSTTLSLVNDIIDTNLQMFKKFEEKVTSDLPDYIIDANWVTSEEIVEMYNSLLSKMGIKDKPFVDKKLLDIIDANITAARKCRHDNLGGREGLFHNICYQVWLFYNLTASYKAQFMTVLFYTLCKKNRFTIKFESSVVTNTCHEVVSGNLNHHAFYKTLRNYLNEQASFSDVKYPNASHVSSISNNPGCLYDIHKRKCMRYMTVGELLKELRKFPKHTEVLFKCKSMGYIHVSKNNKFIRLDDDILDSYYDGTETDNDIWDENPFAVDLKQFEYQYKNY